MNSSGFFDVRDVRRPAEILRELAIGTSWINIQRFGEAERRLRPHFLKLNPELPVLSSVQPDSFGHQRNYLITASASAHHSLSWPLSNVTAPKTDERQ